MPRVGRRGEFAGVRAGASANDQGTISQKMKSIGEISIAPLPAGFREFSTRREREKGSRRSLNIVARRGGGIDCRRTLRTVCMELKQEKNQTPKRPFSTKLRKTLRRYVGARVSSAWLRSPFGSLRPRARRLTALRLENGPQYRRMTARMAEAAAARNLGQGRGERGVGLWGTPRS